MATRFSRGIDFDYGADGGAGLGLVAVPTTPTSRNIFAQLQVSINALLPLLSLPNGGQDLLGPEHGVLTQQTVRGMLTVAARVADPVTTVRDFARGPSVLMLASYAPLLLDTVERYLSMVNTEAIMAATAHSRGQLEYSTAGQRAKMPMNGYGTPRNVHSVPGLQVPTSINAVSTSGDLSGHRGRALRGDDVGPALTVVRTAVAPATMQRTAPTFTTALPTRISPVGPSVQPVATTTEVRTPIATTTTAVRTTIATAPAPVRTAITFPATDTSIVDASASRTPVSIIPLPTASDVASECFDCGPPRNVSTAVATNPEQPADVAPNAQTSSGDGSLAPFDSRQALITPAPAQKKKLSGAFWGVAASAAALLVGGIVIAATSTGQRVRETS